jgi:hypothetical protein
MKFYISKRKYFLGVLRDKILCLTRKLMKSIENKAELLVIKTGRTYILEPE